ncbi:MAG: type II toxin-antitoxin system VapC family toxin [Myxococcales bacterium]|nr:type II toxin-antitoxin system VapC family toxin [Myxococcales bacterium]
MRLVIDASFAVLWVTRERAEPAVTEFDARYHAGQVELHAPELFMVEAASAIWKHVRRGLRTVEETVVMFENLRDVPIRLHRHRDLVVHAFDLALRRGISPYDASYVALAVREVLPLFTADRRLASAVDDLVDVITA